MYGLCASDQYLAKTPCRLLYELYVFPNKIWIQKEK